MFTGTYYNSIDAKGRVIVPVKFREKLEGTFILTKGQDGCLYIYPQDEWEKFRERLSSASMSSDAVRRTKRHFFGNAVETEMDKQGRLMIPQNLRDHAKMDKELVSIGVDEKIEIWAKEVWDDYSSHELYNEEVERLMEGMGF